MLYTTRTVSLPFLPNQHTLAEFGAFAP